MTEASATSTGHYRRSRRREERVRILGWDMDLVRPEEVLHFVDERLARGQKAIVANQNLHSLYLLRRNAEMRRYFEISDLVEVDSIPLLLWSRLIHRNSRRFHRCTYLDWRDAFWRLAEERGWRVYYLGGERGVAEAAQVRLREQYPRLALASHHGYFDMSKDAPDAEAVINDIRHFKPDVLFVGMGMPRQEIWIARFWDRLEPCAIFSVGAAYDYEAGVQVAAPRWLGRAGLEWLFRLMHNPVRLFSRYCYEPWLLIGPAIREIGRSWREKRPPERRHVQRRRTSPRPGDTIPGRRGADFRGWKPPRA